MLRLLVWLTACALLAVAALVALIVQAVDATPLVPPPGELSAASFKRVEGILRANDPRYLPPGASREVRIAGPELQALLDFAARHGLPGRAAIQLGDGNQAIIIKDGKGLVARIEGDDIGYKGKDHFVSVPVIAEPIKVEGFTVSIVPELVPIPAEEKEAAYQIQQ